MKEKKFELIDLCGVPGAYTAVMYNRLCGYYKEHFFMWYTKKQIFYKLRNEYDCSVPRRFYS